MDKTVVKAMGVFELLARAPGGLGVTELASQAGLMKSNAHRVLKTFEQLGYVRQRADGRYEATLKVWEIGTRLIERVDVRSIAREALLRLSKESGETVHLSRLDGRDVLYLEKIDTDNPVRAYTQVGGRSPAHCTATGKVLLAYLADTDTFGPDEELQGFTPKTVTRVDDLRKELVQIRAQGFAENHGEWRTHVGGLAAPVFDHTGAVIAAIGISGPMERLKPKTLRGFAPLVMETAARTSRELGFTGNGTLRRTGS